MDRTAMKVPAWPPDPNAWREMIEHMGDDFIARRRLTREQAVQGMSALTNAVPAEWCNQQLAEWETRRAARERGDRVALGEHELFSYMLRWQTAYFRLLDIGWDMAVLQGCNGYSQIVPDLLAPGTPTKNRRWIVFGQFRHARAVLRLAARLKHQGAVIDLDPPPHGEQGRRCDIAAQKDGTTANFEVKAPIPQDNAPFASQAQSDFSFRFMQRLEGRGAFVRLDGEMIRRWAGIADDDIRSAAIDEVLDEIVEALEKQMEPPFRPPLVELKASGSGSSHFSFGNNTWLPDDNRVLKMLVGNEREGGAQEQLPVGDPAFIVVEPPDMFWDGMYLPMLFRSICRARPQEWEHVTALLEVTERTTGTRDEYGYITVPNPRAGTVIPDWVAAATWPQMSGDQRG